MSDTLMRRAARGVLSMLGRAFPLKSGLARVTNMGASRFAFGECTSDVRVRLRSGYHLRVRADDFNGRMLAIFGTVDPKIVDTCVALVGGGDVFFDIGANHGVVGLACLRKVGDSGAVHWFEPQTDLCERISEASRGRARGESRVHALALSDRDGEAALSEVPRHTGAASIGEAQAGSSAVVEIRDTLGVVREICGGRPLGAKVDVEGGELDVLPGLAAYEGLSFVVYECTGRDRKSEALRVFEDRGWGVLGLRKSALRVELERIVPGTVMSNFDDFLALPGDIVDQVGARATLRDVVRVRRVRASGLGVDDQTGVGT